MTCTNVAVGAYALGALEPAERAEVERHLRECASCAAEAAEFAALPPLLALVPAEDLDAAPIEPSPGLFERMAAAAAAEHKTAQRHSSRRRLLIAVVAAAVLAVGGSTVWWVSGSHETAHTAAAGAVHLTVTAHPGSDGTGLDVAVAGVAPGEDCRLVVVDQDGVRHQAGSWTASYAGRATFRGWTAVSRTEVRDVVLVSTDGVDLVRVRL
ncbi:MAG: Anti-sigma-K factor RskA [Frankiales bacterium]|nr:Anti-sigma-K factor RskA [Frankiales bacterium]